MIGLVIAFQSLVALSAAAADERHRLAAKEIPRMEQRVTPQLRSTNWARTRAFYEDGLGFRVQWEHRFEPGFPVFAQVSRDGLSLFLTEHTGDCQVGGAAYIVVDDLDALYREIMERGVHVDEPPESTPWGTREMCVMDPDNNRLRFAEKATDV
jgi:predicted enzyme related to lactoylglutathione lyase